MEQGKNITRDPMAAWMANGGAIALSLGTGTKDSAANIDQEISAAAGSTALGCFFRAPVTDTEISAAQGSHQFQCRV